MSTKLLLAPQIFIPSHGPEVKPGNYSRSFLVKKVGEIIPSELNENLDVGDVGKSRKNGTSWSMRADSSEIMRLKLG